LENRSGELYWSEFDGNNLINMGPLADGFPAYSSSDMKSLFAFKQTSQAVHITQVVIRH
jgi:hypothetical protein